MAYIVLLLQEIIWITSNKNLKGSLEIIFFSVLQC